MRKTVKKYKKRGGGKSQKTKKSKQRANSVIHFSDMPMTIPNFEQGDHFELLGPYKYTDRINNETDIEGFSSKKLHNATVSHKYAYGRLGAFVNMNGKLLILEPLGTTNKYIFPNLPIGIPLYYDNKPPDSYPINTVDYYFIASYEK